jgi:hypothetical protein
VLDVLFGCEFCDLGWSVVACRENLHYPALRSHYGQALRNGHLADERDG